VVEARAIRFRPGADRAVGHRRTLLRTRRGNVAQVAVRPGHVPVPAGYDQVGINLWDARGTLIQHQLYGYFCGPDPKNGKTYLVCPAHPGG